MLSTCQLQILKDAVDGQDGDENVDISRQDLIFRLSAFTSLPVFSSVWAGNDMGVSKNNGTPKSSILVGFSIINHPCWVPLFLKHPYQQCQVQVDFDWHWTMGILVLLMFAKDSVNAEGHRFTSWSFFHSIFRGWGWSIDMTTSNLTGWRFHDLCDDSFLIIENPCLLWYV